MAGASQKPHHNNRDRKEGEKNNTNPFRKRFQAYARIIDDKNDKHERIVKASRDVTMQSKKIIFDLHRINEDNKQQVLKRAGAAAHRVRKEIATRIATELTPEDYYRFHRAFTPGMQEYIEARTFLSFCELGRIISREDIQAEIAESCNAVPMPRSAEEDTSRKSRSAGPSRAEASNNNTNTASTIDEQTPSSGKNESHNNNNINKTANDDNRKAKNSDPVQSPHPLEVDLSDYVLGVADLTGELMRMALGGKAVDIVTINAAMRDIEREMSELGNRHRVSRDMATKLRVLRQSVAKVERSCYDRTVRSAEIPDTSSAHKRAASDAVRAEGEKRQKIAV